MTYLFKSNWHMPNLLIKKSVKRRVWKTINIISTLAIILNTGLVTAFVQPQVASAATLGPNNGTVFANDATIGTIDWSNPANAQASNNSNTEADLNDNQVSKYLKATGFNFAIPAGSTIDGITVQVERQAETSNRIKDNAVRIVKNGTIGTENKAGNSFWGESDATISYGGVSDLWGTTWTVADINAANFGVVFSAKKDSSAGSVTEARVDHIKITVTYTAPAPVRPIPATNPAFGQTCGLDVALVIDSSGSIGTTELAQMKTAYKDFVDAFLPGTPSEFSVTDFDTTATVTQAFSSNGATVKSAVDTATSGGFTNWDDGLAKAWSTFDPRPAKPNLVLFASDGNPNRVGNPASTVTEQNAVDAAVLQANTIKNAGTRVIALGIGNNLDLNNLKAISGPNVAANAGEITASSDVITGDFATLGTTLAALADELCGGKILVQKLYDTDRDGKADLDGSQPNALLAGWNFDVNGTPSNPDAQVTTNTGSLEFTVQNGTYSVTETAQDNATLNSAQCVLNGATPVGQVDLASQTVSGIPMNTGDTVSCTFLNKAKLGMLRVEKWFDHDGDGHFEDRTPQNWTWDLYQNNQLVAENISPTTVKELPAGIYTATEDASTSYSAQWLCAGSGLNAQDGNSFTVEVAAGENKVCKFKNTRTKGDITFDKVVVGGAAKDGDFTFVVNDQNYKDGQTASFFSGSYALTEVPVAGYTLTNASGACSLGENGVALNVTTQGGTCTITNTRDTGTVIVHKDVKNPDGGSVSDNHGFEVSLSGDKKPVSENTNATYSPVLTGDFSLVETLDANYDFVSCAIGDSQESCENFNVGKNETVHVYVVNKQKKATITINKDVLTWNGQPTTDNAAFTVQRTGGANGSISENSPWVLQVNPGQYTFTELTGSNYTSPDTTETITVQSGEQKSHTFINKQKPGSISGKKFEDENGNGVRNNGDVGLDGWKIYLDLNNNDQWDNGEPYDWTDNNGYYSFTNLNPGTYTVREVNQAGWLQTAPVGGEHTVNLAVNESANGKDFGNYKYGKIWGYKFNDKTGDGNYDHGSDLALPGWTICLNGQNCVVTDQNGKYEFTGLTYGSYNVTEQLATGWYAVAPQLTGYNVNIDSGDVEHKDFFNFKGFDLTVKKLIDGDANLQTTGDQALASTPWTIEVWKNGVKIDTQQTVNGTYTWTNLPHGEYEVKEIFNSNEWQALLSDNITIPNWIDDNSSKTVGEFDAESGRNVEVTFVNWKRAPVKIVASKIICRNESSLPNWGANGGPNVTAATAQNFVNQSEGECWFASDWTFQWGWDWIANPGDNTGESANWYSFGPTGQDGTVAVEIPTLQNSKVWLREAWSPFYIPFTYEQSGNENNVSAEFYCHSDVLNYDNYEWIDGLQLGKDGNQPTYYCVAFNVPNTFDVNIDKVVNLEGEQQTVEAGANLSYTLNWTLTGNTPVDVKLMDPLPANTTFVSADNGGYLDGNTVRWNLGTFNPAANGSVNVTVKVNSPLDNKTVISNTGVVCGLGYVLDGEPFASNREDLRRQKCDEDTTTTTVTSKPVLGIEKTASPTTVGGNQDVTYTIVWSVAGNSKATNVVVNDPIPAQTSYVSMGCGTTTGTCTLSQTGTPVSSVAWNLGTRNPGEGGTLTLVVKTAISVPNNSVIPNTADIRSAEVDPVYAQADVKAATAPILQITKTTTATIVNPGDPISYTVKVKNIGTDTAVNAVMTDTLPAGFSFISTSPVAASIVGQTGTWNLGNMAVGDEKTITYTVNVAPGTTAGTYDNIAKAKADNAPEVSAKVPVQTRVPQVLGETTAPVLEISKTVAKSTVAPDAVITYTVKVKNSGTGSAINVVLQDILPVGFTFNGTDNTTQSWNLGDIAVGETKTVSYKIKVGSSVPSGSYENLAVAQADNHGKVSATAPVVVQRGRVLGESVDTGAGIIDLAIAAAGLSLIVLGFVLTRRKTGNELA